MATPTSVTLPWPAAPPPSPFLAPRPGGGWDYDHIQTGVRATLAEGALTIPIPRASFHFDELAAAFGLPGHLRAVWAEANRAAAEATAAPSIAAELGLAWWRYTVARPALRLAWPSADIVIPDLLFFAARADGAVTTVLVWSEDVRALVIPAAARHVILRPDPLRGRASVSSGLLDRAIFDEALGDRARAEEAPVPHRRYRGGEAHAAMLARLRTAPAEPARAYRPVRPDEIVDREA